MKVVVYTTSTCSYCPMVKRLLNYWKIPFEERNAEDPAVGAEIARLAGVLTVPITLIGDEVVVGYNASRLSEALENVPRGSAYLTT